MDNELKNAVADAERLYATYKKLAELGQLAELSQDSSSSDRKIVASAGSHMLPGYANAVVG